MASLGGGFQKITLARVYPWLYSGLNLISSEAPYQAPDKPQSRWTKLENQKRLSSVRKLDVSGSASVLREWVKTYLTQTGGPPAIPELIGASYGTVCHLICSLTDMLTCIMGMDGSNDPEEDGHDCD